MRITGPLLKVLREMAADPGREIYGLELSRATGLKSGTLYPLLDRLESVGWVRSRWEDAGLKDRTAPRRRFYLLTATGLHEARFILAEHGIGGVLWA
jgi:PadR family transcriptional regulator PadR